MPICRDALCSAVPGEQKSCEKRIMQASGVLIGHNKYIKVSSETNKALNIRKILTFYGNDV
jgi:hypothetical protein